MPGTEPHQNFDCGLKGPAAISGFIILFPWNVIIQRNVLDGAVDKLDQQMLV